MRGIKFFTLAVSFVTAIATNASVEDGKLYIAGDAMSYGYSLDDAQALLATADAPSVFVGTLYLQADKDFKFLETYHFGNTEIGATTEQTEPVLGDVVLSKGTGDSGYNKLKVAESGNYYIEIDTENLVGKIVKSEYQDAPIYYCSLFLVGGATGGGWSVDNGTPLYQQVDNPYLFSSEVTLGNESDSSASFKITNAVKGGGTWQAKYWLYRDADDNGKITTDSTDDRQWTVAEYADYNVTVNLIDNTISIDKIGDAGVEAPICDNQAVAEYYNLQGIRVEQPTSGVYIVVKSGKAHKQVVK